MLNFKSILFCFILMSCIISVESFASERLFFEDCEDTSYSSWFLERSMGTSSYWSELTSDITRSSSNCYAGNYCLTYDPWTTGNPHGNIGVITSYGNTSGFDIGSVVTNTYYFRWKHKWSPGVSYSGSAMNKNLYLGYHDWGGDFTLAFEKSSSSGWHLLVMSNPGYVIRVNKYPSAGISVDDGAWHDMEVYIDLGTTGATGTLQIKVDGQIIYENLNVYYRDAIHINGDSALNIIQWPSNTSGTPVGTNVQWLDNLEIWNGLPDSETTTPSPVIISPPHVNAPVTETN
jgi:hypothetical protein